MYDPPAVIELRPKPSGFVTICPECQLSASHRTILSGRFTSSCSPPRIEVRLSAHEANSSSVLSLSSARFQMIVLFCVENANQPPSAEAAQEDAAACCVRPDVRE